MLNEFYHEIEVSFNFWMLVGPLMVLTMGILGWTRYHMKAETDVVYERSGEMAVVLISIFLDTLFHALLIIESATGIWQLLVNHLDGDIAWMPFVMAMALLFSFVGVYYVLYGVAKIGSWLKIGYLMDARNRRKEERRKRIARQFKNLPDLTKTPSSVLEYFSDCEIS